MRKRAACYSFMMVTTERDYVLGTHEEELVRLGLQHRVWRPTVLECWQEAGLTVGKRILDVGAGPGYATIDLAEIVGPSGEVVAVERSHNFISAIEGAVRGRGLTNVKIHELDLMKDDLPTGPFDFSWCRWVLCFVADPAVVIGKIAASLGPSGTAVFHEYGHYETWRFIPPLPSQETFREHVVATWHESGGEPDAGRSLPALLADQGLEVRSLNPRIFCIRPNDYMWQWPLTFIEGYLPRLQEMGRIDQKFADQLKAEMNALSRDPNALMITPLVLEVVADKFAR